MTLEESWENLCLEACEEEIKVAFRTLTLALVAEALGDCDSSACGSVQHEPESIKRWGEVYRCKPCGYRARIEALP